MSGGLAWPALVALLLGCSGKADPTGSDLASEAAATPASETATVTPGNNAIVSEQFTPVAFSEAPPLPNVPGWAADAVFYQIFPERFANGDSANDPTRESLEFPDLVPDDWTIAPWTSDWYARSEWERQAGPSFWDNGVFNRRYGGDLQGVLDKLDYLADLGVNALYFNPVFYARSLHKYDGASMHHVDPYFGPDPAGDFELMSAETSDPATWQWTAADKLFLKVLAEARRRNMRVIIDGVFNHTGRDFFAFADLREKQAESPYRDWYIVQHFDDPATPGNEFRYKGWWGIDTLPEFADAPGGNDLHPGPKAYLMDVTRRWMDPDGDGDPSDGIDGWRLDVANEVPIPFWKDWNKLVRELNPQAYTVAEIWEDARTFLTEGGFSATMNYHAFAFPVKGYLIDGRLTPHDFGHELQVRRREYPPAMQFALQNLVDSHDTDRVASMIVNRPGEEPYVNPDRFDYDVTERVSPRHYGEYKVGAPDETARAIQRMTVLMQMTYVGPPMVYYGDEAGMWGGDDPCARKPMVWPELTYDPEVGDPHDRPRTADQVAFDRSLHDFYKAAIALRNSLPVLRRGSFTASTVDDQAKFFSFLRSDGDRHVLVGFNRGSRSYGWSLPAEPAAEWSLALATSPEAEASGAVGRVVKVPPLSGIVLVSEAEPL
ncbi:MAG: hypothetical protein KF847_01760 [Pirellulales bacterium]|nr:hypothetical protein [Pirellulales bacterium]